METDGIDQVHPLTFPGLRPTAWLATAGTVPPTTLPYWPADPATVLVAVYLAGGGADEVAVAVGTETALAALAARFEAARAVRVLYFAVARAALLRACPDLRLPDPSG